MSMINELVKELRRAENPCSVVSVGYYRNLYARAADTIEELSAKLADANMERSTAYYNNGWIPCSERPPEEPCIYTVEDCSPYTVNKHGEPQRRTIILKPLAWEPYHRVIAWKPINIEPYKGVE